MKLDRLMKFGLYGMLKINLAMAVGVTNTMADDLGEISLMFDRGLLKQCQSKGIDLYHICIVSGGEINAKFCGATLAYYRTCLSGLNRSLYLDSAPDPYLGRIFSPCGSQIANLILPEICLKQ